jgi:hypothetical protein
MATEFPLVAIVTTSPLAGAACGCSDIVARPTARFASGIAPVYASSLASVARALAGEGAGAIAVLAPRDSSKRAPAGAQRLLSIVPMRFSHL